MAVVLVGSLVWSLVTGVAGATGTEPATDPCAGALDAVNDGERRCRSPGAASAAPLVDADTITVTPSPLRDPLMFPGELGFLAVAVAVAGGGAVAGAVLVDGTTTNASSEALRQGTLYGGVGLLSLSGAIAAAAVATWVFDVANGTLRLPLFDGEAP